MTAFRSFVIFAEMRTGSNLLEATLNAIKYVTCFGEAFNPYMMGWPDKDELRGITMAEREADPHSLLRALFGKPDHLAGFRYFHDHDPRVFDAIMDDPSCAKIVLTRNPIDSWVSTQLAYATNQWKLNATETAIPAAVEFDAASFRESLGATQAFLDRIHHGLQARGQAAFWLNYDDLRDADVMTGLLHWLGRTDLDRVEPAQDQVPQNPREMAEKVTNFEAMQAELVATDPFQLHRIPGFEPKRGPAVPSFLTAGAGRGLLFMPVRGGPSDRIEAWLSALGPVEGELTQNALRQWKRAHPGHRAFTVLRHPLPRAWEAFHVMLAARNPDLRRVLREVHRIGLPPDEDLHALTEAARRGVDVQVMVPEDSNHIVADWASRGFFGKMLEAGITILLYRASMIHAKTATVDGIWSTVGSANVDRLSLGFNYESNVVVVDRDFAARMEEIFALDAQRAVRIDTPRWEDRHGLARVVEALLVPLRPLL